MAASKYDFSIEQGTSFTLSLTYKDSSETPINLTGYCARLVWKTNTGTSVFTTETANSNYRFDIDEVNGRIILQFPAATTNNFTFSTAKYDLELQSSNELYAGGGKYTTRMLYGTITMVKRFSQTDNVLECNT